MAVQEGKTEPAAGQISRPRWSEFADLAATFNPTGIDLSGGIEYRDPYRYDSGYDTAGSYWKAGAGMELSPAYAQPSVYLEWMPFLFATGRVQYDRYSYFGTNGGVLSFSSAQEPFGDQELKALKGSEQSGAGSRVLFQPMLQAKIGDFVVRNQSDVARYRFPGTGPFFLVQEYDTLLPNNGRLFANRTQVLKEMPSPDGKLLIGPYYEVVRGGQGTSARRQVGILLYSERSGSKAADREHHYFAQIGYNLTDRNRQGEIFFLMGLGFSSVLK